MIGIRYLNIDRQKPRRPVGQAELAEITVGQIREEIAITKTADEWRYHPSGVAMCDGCQTMNERGRCRSEGIKGTSSHCLA